MPDRLIRNKNDKLTKDNMDEIRNFENDTDDIDYQDSLALERAVELEIELEKEETRNLTESEAPERTKLKRELEREALLRMEDAARTEADFQKVIAQWNRLDSNRERKERYHEVGRSDVPLEWGASSEEVIIPHPIQHIFWKQITKGEFLDSIFNCPFEMHELIEEITISNAIKNLKPEQKELLFYLAIRQYSCQKIAEIRKQSDRNIRKVRDTMLKKLRKQISPLDGTS